MKASRIVAFILAGLVIGARGQAQPAQADPQARARLRENINTLMLLRMTEALDLSEEQTAKLFPPLTRIEKEKADLQRRMATEVRTLREALQSEPVREPDVLASVNRVRELRRAVREKDEEFEAVVEANLTPVQKGKYVIFLVDFARGLGERLNRARQVRGKN
jgi:Spy/CpxP family protein refolding chaperone